MTIKVCITISFTFLCSLHRHTTIIIIDVLVYCVMFSDMSMYLFFRFMLYVRTFV